MSDHIVLGSEPSPLNDTHDINGLNCWCSPLYYMPCECVGKNAEPGCWRCDSGKIPMSHAEAVAATEAFCVVHRR